MTIKGWNPHLHHGRISLNLNISVKYAHTDQQIADTGTHFSITRDKWKELMRIWRTEAINALLTPRSLNALQRSPLQRETELSHEPQCDTKGGHLLISAQEQAQSNVGGKSTRTRHRATDGTSQVSGHWETDRECFNIPMSDASRLVAFPRAHQKSRSHRTRNVGFKILSLDLKERERESKKQSASSSTERKESQNRSAPASGDRLQSTLKEDDDMATLLSLESRLFRIRLRKICTLRTSQSTLQRGVSLHDCNWASFQIGRIVETYTRGCQDSSVTHTKEILNILVGCLLEHEQLHDQGT